MWEKFFSNILQSRSSGPQKSGSAEDVFYQYIFEDLDFISYLKYFFNFINNYRNTREGLQELKRKVEDVKEIFGDDFFLQNSLLSQAHTLTNSGIFVFPKNPEKKKFHQITTNNI